jgi:hypothetical protein
MVWLDSSGLTSMHYYDTGDATGDVIAGDIANLSNAGQLAFWHGDLTVYSPPTVPGGDYTLVQTYALLTFTDGVGGTVTLRIPAPLTTIFAADGRTVSPAAIAALIADVVGHVVTPAGNLVTAYVTGTLQGRRGLQP